MGGWMYAGREVGVWLYVVGGCVGRWAFMYVGACVYVAGCVCGRLVICGG